MKKVIHPSIYQINTRLLLSRLSKSGKRAQLKDIPTKYWKWLHKKGMDYVWLMGVWNTNEKGFEVERQEWEIDKYQSVLPDFKEEDLRGSPYAIDQYILDPQMGENGNLLHLKKVINAAGLKLILDFVPNHFGAHSSLIKSNPELFMQGSEEQLKAHPKIFFRHKSGNIFAHGKDPNFDPWMDTVQVNIGSKEARAFLSDSILDISNYCDGVRCDMSMLLQKHVFQRTWGQFTDQKDMSQWNGDFWPKAIQRVKDIHPEFLFIAECYWSMEQEMQDHGFDYTYDKALLDKMLSRNVDDLKWHLKADKQYQHRSVRFLENHDETPVQSTMPQDQHFASAVLMSHLAGMRLYHFGQWEGRRLHVPVQLRRGSNEIKYHCLISNRLQVQAEKTFFNGITEVVCLCTWWHYQELLKLTSNAVMKSGEWQFIEFQPFRDQNDSYNQLIGYLWKKGKKKRLLIVNYSDRESEGVFELENIDTTTLKKVDQNKYLIQLLPFKYLVEDLLDS
jgi:hypothetical protein